MKILSVILSVFSLCIFLTDAETDLCKDGKSQSPIALYTATAEYNPTKTEVAFNFYSILYSKGQTAFLRNTGESLSVTLHGTPAFLEIGGRQYHLEYTDFHWGSTDTQGSEHSIDDEFFSGEIEFVFKNILYKSFEEAFGKSDGFVIVSVLLKQKDGLQDETTGLDKLYEHIASVQRSSSAFEFPASHFNVEKLLPKNRDFFKYRGSFSSYPCEEEVRRIVFKTPLEVSSSFLERLRTLQNERAQPIQDNYRAIQDLNGRTVYKSFI